MLSRMTEVETENKNVKTVLNTTDKRLYQQIKSEK